MGWLVGFKSYNIDRTIAYIYTIGATGCVVGFQATMSRSLMTMNNKMISLNVAVWILDCIVRRQVVECMISNFIVLTLAYCIYLESYAIHIHIRRIRYCHSQNKEWCSSSHEQRVSFKSSLSRLGST